MRSPITSERENIQLLRESGFTQQQAEAVATVVERAVQTGFDKFSEVLARELGALRTELKSEISALRTELKSEIADLRVEVKTEIRDTRYELHKSMTDQGWKIIGAVLTIVTIAVAIIKLFPNVPG